jgi:uncharacterized phage protein (TIGR02220 family)
MNNGFIKLYRCLLDNPVVCKDADHLAVWIYLLLHATHKEIDIMYSGKRRKLNPGQLRISRSTIASKLSISGSKVQRILKTFEIEQQIEQQTNFHDRVITILNWNEYQQSEQQNKQQVNSNRTASEQQVNANKNDKNDKNDKKDIYSAEAQQIIDYLNQKAGTTYRYTSEKNKTLIKARMDEHFTVEDFKKVIDIKVAEWKETDMAQYLRPITLFGTKFESYLNQKPQQSNNESDKIPWAKIP